MNQGLQNLIKAARDNAEESVVDTYGQMSGDSEIERLMVSAIFYHGWSGNHEYMAYLLDKDEPLPKEAVMSGLMIFVKQQVPIERWRADIVCYVWDREARVLPKRGWRELVIECDGHNFHERTKEQAARDRSRDRAMVLSNRTVLRFTGSEIWRDAWGCAGQIFDWAARSL